MDDADRSTEREEKARELALQYRKPSPLACGACLHCNIEVRPGQCFCDADCRDDYELAEAARRRNGK